ncbi:MAG: tRNA(fMet)-specific endonuclease VapC [Verrucomicrobiales bacterium]|jgi:tRNA(fMet)-specific endonuclease VapC
MILDTNALSAFADADRDLLDALSSNRPWSLPVVVIGEYRYSLLGSTQRIDREQWLANLIGVVTVLPITEVTTVHYATVRHGLKLADRKIPPNDLWIAALALEHRLPVLTRDAHFDHIKGVARKSW